MTMVATWLGIAFCLSQSAMLSGLNLGLFSVSRLELTVAARKGDQRAQRMLALREDANFTLVTILWGNVSVNVLLALLSGSVLSGAVAFLFSTVIITLFAEIAPQAYFTRYALPLVSRLSPMLKFYQWLLYPVARPTARVLDAWLGPEALQYIREKDLRHIIRLHIEAHESEISAVEGQGALNFLELDDVPLHDEGELLDPQSILHLDFEGGRAVFPQIRPSSDDPFLHALSRSGKSWAVLVDTQGEPRLMLRTNDFLRQALFAHEDFDPHRHCRRPILVRDNRETLGDLIRRFQVRARTTGDDIVEDDIILYWGVQPRVVTGTDILGRLLRGIARPAGLFRPSQGNRQQD